MQTRTNSGGPYLQGCEQVSTSHIGTLPRVRPARKKLSGQRRSMKDLHVTENGLCLLPLQHTDNCLSFKDLLRVCAGKSSYLELVTCSLTYSGLAAFQMQANLTPNQTDGNEGRIQCGGSGKQLAEEQQSVLMLTFEGLAFRRGG